MSGPISLAEYAKHRGVSKVAVSKAVRAKRLRESVVVVDGQPKIGDVAKADAEWTTNCRRAKAAPPRQSAPVIQQDQFAVSRIRGYVLLCVLRHGDEPTDGDPFFAMDAATAEELGHLLIAKARRATDDVREN